MRKSPLLSFGLQCRWFFCAMQEADDFIMLRGCTKACYLEASLWAVVKDVHKEQKRLHRTLRSQVNLAKTKLIVTRFASQSYLHISVKSWTVRGLSNLYGKLERYMWWDWVQKKLNTLAGLEARTIEISAEYGSVHWNDCDLEFLHVFKQTLLVADHCYSLSLGEYMKWFPPRKT